MTELQEHNHDEVDQLLLNAALRDALEPFLDESVNMVDSHTMTTSKENEYLASMLAWERSPLLPLSSWFEPELKLPDPDDLADHVKLTSSSGDTVIQPTTDAKDIIIKQFDGTELVNFNDGAYSSFTSAALNPEATLTDASTISWNALTQPVAKVTLGANRTLGAASGGVAGQFVSLLIIQDGTGSRTVTFNAAYEFKDDTAPTLTTTAAKGDLFVFRYNGSKWLEVGRNQNLTLS